MQPTLDGNVFTGSSARTYTHRREEVMASFMKYKTMIYSDLIGCCFITSDFLFSILSQSSFKGRKWQQLWSQLSSTKHICYKERKTLSFFSEKEGGLFLFILYRNPAFQTPFRSNSTNPDNTESFTSFPCFPSLFSQVHFPKVKLHYIDILLSQGKVIIFSFLLPPLVCCVSMRFTESEAETF